MGALSPTHIILILGVVVLLFGGSKIPQLMRGLGQGTGEFKKGLEESRSVTDEKKPDDEKKSSDAKDAVAK